MDIYRASDGAYERCDIVIGDFDSLTELTTAVSNLLSIPQSNIILFVASTGEQLSDSVFEKLWEVSRSTETDVGTEVEVDSETERGTGTASTSYEDIDARTEDLVSSFDEERRSGGREASDGRRKDETRRWVEVGDDSGSGSSGVQRNPPNTTNMTNNLRDRRGDVLRRAEEASALPKSSTSSIPPPRLPPLAQVDPFFAASSGPTPVSASTTVHSHAAITAPTSPPAHVPAPASTIGIYCFDRDSFTSDPVDFVRGLEESLLLAPALPVRAPRTSVYPYSLAGPSNRSSYSSSSDPNQHLNPNASASATSQVIRPFEENMDRLREVEDRLRIQIKGLQIAEGNLRLHLGLLMDGRNEDDDRKGLLQDGVEGDNDEYEDDEDENENGNGEEKRSVEMEEKRKRLTASQFERARKREGNGKKRKNSMENRKGRRTGTGKGTVKVDVVGEGWKGFAQTVEQELEREERLVAISSSSASASSGSPTKVNTGVKAMSNLASNRRWGMEDDMQLISRIQVHPCFLSASSNKQSNAMTTGRRSIDGGVPATAMPALAPAATTISPSPPSSAHKTLGDFVNATKMRTVRDSCQRMFEDHCLKYDTLRNELGNLELATNEVTRSVAGLVAHVETEIQDAFNECVGIVDEAKRLAFEDPERNWTTLQVLDANLREVVINTTHLKNDFTLQLHIHLHQISIQQSTIATLPPAMAALEEVLISTRTSAKTGFPHLDRLHNMLFAYGSVCIEVLWRKEISAAILDGASAMVEDWAEFLEKENSRRKTFMHDVLTLLPYEVDLLGKGSKFVPRLDLSAAGGGEDIADWQMNSDDIEALFRNIENIQADLGDGGRDIKAVLDDLKDLHEDMLDSVTDLRAKLDRRKVEHTTSATQTLSCQVVSLQAKIDDIQATHTEEKKALETEQAKLQAQVAALCHDIQASQAKDQEHEAELAGLNEARRQLEDLSDQLRKETERADKVTEEKYLLERQLEEERLDRESERQQISTLESERSEILKGLSDARNDEEKLAAELMKVQAELDITLVALEETRQERDEALHEQASVAEKVMRDHLVEATGDRAVLEHQNLNLTKELEDLHISSETQLSTIKNQSAREINGLKAEMGLAKAQLRDAQKSRAAFQEELDQLKDALSHAERERDRQRRFGKDAIKVASNFYECVARLHTAIQSSATISGSTSALIPRLRHNSQESYIDTVTQTTTDVDEKLLETELASLQAYDLVAFADAVARTMTLVKKWQKSCKQYRERAKEKIAFANFVKGDLALFLPTRNVTTRVWAAFNISSPHNFLKPTPEIAEQTQYREWVVARITMIEEDVVDSRRPDSNPYGLAEGLRYHTLHVESYTPPPPRFVRAGSTITNQGDVTKLSASSSGLGPDSRSREGHSQAETEATKGVNRLSSPRHYAQNQVQNLSSNTLRSRADSGEPRPRPASVASSAGSNFGRGLQYASSSKAPCSIAVTSPSQPGHITSSPLGKDLQPPPIDFSHAGVPTSLGGSSTPRTDQSEFDPGLASVGNRLSTSPIGMGQGALDILRKFEKGKSNVSPPSQPW